MARLVARRGVEVGLLAATGGGVEVRLLAVARLRSQQRRLRGLAEAALEEADDQMREELLDHVEEGRVALRVVAGEPEGLVVVLRLRRRVRRDGEQHGAAGVAVGLSRVEAHYVAKIDCLLEGAVLGVEEAQPLVAQNHVALLPLAQRRVLRMKRP